MEKLFALRKKYKHEHNDLKQGLVKLLTNSLFGVQLRRDINDFYKCKSEHWMKTDYDDIVLDYWKLSNGNYTVKIKKDEGLDGGNDVKYISTCKSGSFYLKQ